MSHLVIDLGSSHVHVINELVHEVIVRLFINLAAEALLHCVAAHLLKLKLLDALGEQHDALFERLALRHVSPLGHLLYFNNHLVR